LASSKGEEDEEDGPNQFTNDSDDMASCRWWKCLKDPLKELFKGIRHGYFGATVIDIHGDAAPRELRS
jgi:hypothetical protein